MTLPGWSDSDCDVILLIMKIKFCVITKEKKNVHLYGLLDLDLSIYRKEYEFSDRPFDNAPGGCDINHPD